MPDTYVTLYNIASAGTVEHSRFHRLKQPRVRFRQGFEIGNFHLHGRIFDHI